jgi:broad specificity phosphatase PhoE
MFTCTIIRHAAKQPGNFFNPTLRHQDQPISDKGQRQAELLLPYFTGKPTDAIYVSEYQRTGQTIAPLAAICGLIPIVDPRLNEVDNGILDNMSEEEVQERLPEFWKVYAARDVDFRYPEGECNAEVRERALSFLADVRLRYPGGHVIAVSHDGLIRQMICSILGLPVRHSAFFQVDYCGIAEIAYEEEYATWRLVRMNQVCR